MSKMYNDLYSDLGLGGGHLPWMVESSFKENMGRIETYNKAIEDFNTVFNAEKKTYDFIGEVMKIIKLTIT
jgi:hypothetical protein